jgi:sugar phosphate isomerase/epimerase
MHPRITVNQVCFGKVTTLREDVDLLGEAGASRMGVHRDKLAAGGWAVEALSGLTVTHLIHRDTFTLDAPEAWPGEREELARTVDAAVELGAGCVYLTTGPRGRLGWDEAVAAFAEAVAPVEQRVPLLVETANPQFADIHFLHTLRDTVDVAGAAGIGVCVDIHPCWTERGLRETIGRASGSIGLVQVSDYAPGTYSLSRSVPGDGIIPLEAIIGWIAEGGYDGFFDLELRGPYDEGDVSAVRRAAAQLAPILERACG